MMFSLTFKKAFGLKSIPVDYSIWFLELGNIECTFTIDSKNFTVKIGKFGVSEQEKLVIGGFFHTDERDPRYISEIITLDIAFDVDLDVPEIHPGNGLINSRIDIIVAPFIHDAFNAACRFIDAYRSAKYKMKRGSDDWKKRELFLIPELLDAEFKTLLFYQLQNSERTFAGVFSEGQRRTTSSTDIALITQQMQDIVQVEIPLNSKLIVKAWEYLFQEDYRNAVIYAVTVLELTLIKTLRKRLISNSVASDSRIDTFLDDVSNRLLCTVMLGVINIGNEELREKIASVFDLRNGLVHGKRKKSVKLRQNPCLIVQRLS